MPHQPWFYMKKTFKCKAFLDTISSNAVNCKSTLIKLFKILQVTNLFSKYTFLIKIIYFCVQAFKKQFELIKTFDDIPLKKCLTF